MAAPKTPFQVKAVYEYSSPHDDDLSFPNGQLITVTDEEDADWYYGEYLDASGDKQEGLFPRNFVKMYEPETPPRPSRPSRQRKDNEPSPVVKQEGLTEDPRTLATPYEPTLANSAVEDIKQTSKPRSQELSEGQTTNPPEQLPQAPSSIKKSTLPPVDAKPASGSFRDRINAFNKPAAPPVAPKPPGPGSSGGTGFIKKPFVAPPPSKNAYIPPPREAPPQKIYRRDEDPEISGQSASVDPAEQPSKIETPISAEDAQDQPKPTSLKDRIALLQKQQIEQAARHVEGAQKKDKPKKPPKKRMDSHEKTVDFADEEEGHDLNKVTSTGTNDSHRYDDRDKEVGSEDTLESNPPRNVDLAMIGSPLTAAARGFQSDANDADQSGAGDTEEGEETSTGRDDSDEKPRNVAPQGIQKVPRTPFKEADVGDEEDDADEEEENGDEEEMDPEVKRRMEIRERMAKMSGGMGMAGMFGPPGGMPGMAPKKQTSVSSERKTVSGESEAQMFRAPPVPVMPMPGMQRAQSPDQDMSEVEVHKEQSEPALSIVQGRRPDDMPDVEDMDEQPRVPQRMSLERPAPPPLPQGQISCIMKVKSLLTIAIDRPVPAAPGQTRALPPPSPVERPVPAKPSNCKS